MARTLRTPPTVHAPSKHGLQPDDVLIARGQMRHGFHAARFQRPRDDQRIHADARHRAAVDVDGVHFLRGHDFVDLLVNALERNPFRRIDLHADGKFFLLQFFPELAFWFAFRNAARVVHWNVNRVMRLILRGPQRLYRLGHRANVRRSRAAASAENPHADCRGFPGE